ncbi:hypothetical protein E4U19_002568 [Claviceps sp. Clav32 group G5]|nr:hypothetical protein E4U19_002568 [Claviceps sp. Clav32 group G5]KAG6046940.1 hypothetical protein E4U39_000913 [Claviceps sp. Clav50 group G5]
MSGAPRLFASPLLGVIAAVAAFTAALIYTAELPRMPIVLGFWRQNAKTVVADPQDFHFLSDTVHCEDLHYHESSDLLFTACEGTEHTRQAWFPALGLLGDPTTGLRAQGALEVIDPHTMKVKKLTFTNFNGPFVTHGIDVLDDPEKPEGEAVYIFAVNHVPSPAYSQNKNAKGPKARSIIEVFYYIIGSDTVAHVRSVWDPLITTPNDIVAVSPTSFFVTNDHYYREGLLRDVEDLFYGAKWSNVIHVEFQDLIDASFRDDDHGVKASVALDGLHNNNGLSHGQTPDDILIGSTASGRVHVGKISSPSSETGHHGDGSRKITLLKDKIDLDSSIDNPSWFRDPYAQSGRDLSGVVAAGLTRAVDLSKSVKNGHGEDGVMVWMARPYPDGESLETEKTSWEKKLLFQDDSSRIRTASSAVLVAIDPATENGKRKAWLFVTGFLSTSMIAVKVSL